MNTMNRTPLQAPSRPDAVSAGGASSTVRAQLDALPDDTVHYLCITDRARHAEGQIGNLWVKRNDEDFTDFDAGLARFLGWAPVALAAAGGFLIGWSL